MSVKHNNELSIADIDKRLNKDKELFPENIAEEIFKLYSTADVPESEKKRIKEKYLAALEKWRQSDLINKKMDYAIKLMNYNGPLEYEEIHLLFSLFDTIYSMENIGLQPDTTLSEKYRAAQTEFIMNREPKRSRLVAQDKVEDWKKNREWYKLI
jgi:hypothetical protein